MRYYIHITAPVNILNPFPLIQADSDILILGHLQKLIFLTIKLMGSVYFHVLFLDTMIGIIAIVKDPTYNLQIFITREKTKAFMNDLRVWSKPLRPQLRGSMRNVRIGILPIALTIIAFASRVTTYGGPAEFRIHHDGS